MRMLDRFDLSVKRGGDNLPSSATQSSAIARLGGPGGGMAAGYANESLRTHG